MSHMSKKNIKVVMLSPFRKFSDTREFMMEFEEKATFGDMVSELVKKYGSEFASTLMDEDKKIHDSITVLIDGKNISTKPDSGFSEPLKENGTYIFCAFMAGG